MHNFFFEPLNSHRFFCFGYVLAGFFFLLIFLVDRLVKGIHFKSNYKESVKESLKKSINFNLIESFCMTFIRQYMWLAWCCSCQHVGLWTRLLQIGWVGGSRPDLHSNVLFPLDKKLYSTILQLSDILFEMQVN